eukprot:m.757266 g.757266  ORF g.757266 m.757266 type:complete len:126 (-) comp23187_c0_seq19:425-802(-)
MYKIFCRLSDTTTISFQCKASFCIGGKLVLCRGDNSLSRCLRRFKLSLYMVSNVKPESRSTWSASQQAIRVMDLDTFNPIAPDVPLLQNCDRGCYWTLQYNSSVRLRVMPINNDAGFSALFFDDV